MGRMWLTEDSAAWFELRKLDRFLTSCGALTRTRNHLPSCDDARQRLLQIVCVHLPGRLYMSFTEMCANRISTRPAFINTIRVLCLVVISFSITNIAGMDLSALWDLSDFEYPHGLLQPSVTVYRIQICASPGNTLKKNDGTAFTSKVAGIDVPVWDEHAEKRNRIYKI